MTRKEVVKFIQETDGKIFSIKFIKRSTGDERQMVARTGVKSHLKGGKPSYDFKEKDLIPVFDMQKQAYRSIPIEGITAIKIDGDWVKVEGWERSPSS